MMQESAYETRVPADESPVECPYCDRPLETEELLVLHEGIEHWERLDDETYQRENEDLRTFRLKMLGLLVVVYFAFLFIYSYYTNDPFSVATLVAFGVAPKSSEWADSVQ